jgi:hypothetical protein
VGRSDPQNSTLAALEGTEFNTEKGGTGEAEEES